MTASTQNVQIGPGRLYVAPVGESNPDETTVAYGSAWGGNWVDLGDFVEGSGSRVRINEDYVDVYTEQMTAPVTAVRKRREASIMATLIEMSATTMAYLLDGTAATTAAGGAQKGYYEVPFGTNSDVDFYKWGLETLAQDASGNNQPIRWFFHIGYLMSSAEIANGKAAPSGLAVEIKCLGDSSQSAGEELGIFQHVTAAATS